MRHIFQANPGMYDSSQRYCSVCGYVENTVIMFECSGKHGILGSPIEREADMAGYVVHGVNGHGPRCGCGGKSVLHLRRVDEYSTTPQNSRFYCTACIIDAFSAFDAASPRQPYWPGDEERGRAVPLSDDACQCVE
jgi:hypothetical protein